MSFVSSAPEYRTKRKSDLRREVAYFLASPGAVEAARLGWTDLDLFGVDADRPYTRIDGLGLVPALDGCKIIALSAEGAVLEATAGVRQSYRCAFRSKVITGMRSYRRKPEQSGQVLVWKVGS